MTLPSKRRFRIHIGEINLDVVYGIGMFFLITAVIIGASSMVYGLYIGNTFSFVNWGIASVVLFLIGIVMKMAGTKIRH